MIELNKKRIQEIGDEGILALKNVLGYLLLPIAIPLMFIQELISYVREKTGLRRRTLEGKVKMEWQGYRQRCRPEIRSINAHMYCMRDECFTLKYISRCQLCFPVKLYGKISV